MKGLMVSLIIVIFAGVASSVSAAGQQAGEDAAGFRPRLGLQPIRAIERPGPDDSEDKVDWPAPTSLLSRNSTNTSNSFGSRQSGSQQFGSPAPASKVDQDIRFDVKISDDAISKLRQGLKVSANVDVRDRSTNTLLPPEVVSDIAFFRNANENKDMVGVRLEPAPMEPNSKTLRFEIDESQLDRIERDAFVFSVPDQLRGRFNEIEFVKASGPTGLSSGVRGGTRGARFGDSSSAGRFNTDRPSGFGSTSDPSKFAEQWGAGSPQPGPSFEPGGSQFTGPYIEPNVIEARRNQVAPIDSNLNFGQQGSIPPRQNGRPTLNTRDRFEFAGREPGVQSKRSPFGLPRESEDQNTINRRNGLDRGDVINRRAEPTEADMRLAAMQQQLDFERAEKERLARDANQLRDQANLIAQQRDIYSERLREASSRPVVQQSVANGPSGYRETDAAYWDRALDTAGDIVRPYGTRREDFQTREASYESRTMTDNEIQLQRENARLAEKLRLQVRENGQLESRLTQRVGPGQSEIQKTSYDGSGGTVDSYVSTADRRNAFGSVYQNRQGSFGQQQVNTERREMLDRTKAKIKKTELEEEPVSTKSRGASDLIWLLPLLLGSLGLNFFLWIHCRTLDLRYNDLADELRDMVGTSTTIA